MTSLSAVGGRGTSLSLSLSLSFHFPISLSLMLWCVCVCVSFHRQRQFLLRHDKQWRRLKRITKPYEFYRKQQQQQQHPHHHQQQQQYQTSSSSSSSPSASPYSSPVAGSRRRQLSSPVKREQVKADTHDAVAIRRVDDYDADENEYDGVDTDSASGRGSVCCTPVDVFFSPVRPCFYYC